MIDGSQKKQFMRKLRLYFDEEKNQKMQFFDWTLGHITADSKI